MEEVPVEALRKSFELILDICQCAVCLETVKLEMVQCGNGHLICVSCKKDMKTCPTCRDKFCDIKPSKFITQLISALPARCKHCNLYLSLDKDHEKFCGFSPTTCRLCDDTQILSLGILDHIKNSHPKDLIFGESNYNLKWAEFFPNTVRSGVSPVSVFSVFLWMVMENYPDDKFKFSFVAVPNGKVDHDIFVKVVFSSKVAELVSKFKLDLDPECKMKFVSIPSFMLPNFIDNTGALKFKVIFRKQIYEL